MTNAWSRRRFLVGFGGGIASVVVVSACSSSEPLADAPEDAAAPLSWQQVSFGFVSAYLLQRGNEVTIVDTGGGSIAEFEAGLSELGAGWNNVVNVVLTHSHGDHIGGLGAVFDNAPTAQAFAGSGDLDAIASGGFDAERITGVADGDEVFGLEVIATPGHTPGHICVFDPDSGLLVAGDAINTRSGSITGPNPDFTPDMSAAEASVAKILQGRSIDTALVGHGAPVEGSAGASLADLVASLG